MSLNRDCTVPMYATIANVRKGTNCFFTKELRPVLTNYFLDNFSNDFFLTIFEQQKCFFVTCTLPAIANERKEIDCFV